MNFKLFKQIAAENILLTDLKFLSELNMEAFIIENPKLLTTDDYSNAEIIINQMYLKSGRKSKSKDGRIDLLANIDQKYIAIIELKNGIIINDHIKQLEDYLDEFIKNKDHHISELRKEYNVLGNEILGFIIGTDILPEIKAKLSNGYTFQKIPIIGMTINRYSSKDNKEVFVLSEIFAPTKSDFYRIRFNTWEEFHDFQKSERNINDNTLKIGKIIHDKAIKIFDLTKNEINYAKTVFTLNVPVNKKRTLFAYCQLLRNKIRIFMDYENQIPNGGKQNPDPRFPNTFYINIFTEDQIDDNFIKLLKNSYKLVSQ